MSTPNSLCWHILGAGAIGCLWAFYLRKAGHRVVLLVPSARNGRTLHLTRAGYTESVDIEWQLISKIDKKPHIDNLLVTAKAHHTLPSLQTIRSSLSESATIVFLQNGMAANEAKRLLTQQQQAYVAISTDGAYRTDQLSVVYAGAGITSIGFADDVLNRLPIDDLVVENCNDIETRQWQKLAVNCAINALTVIYQCKNGGLLEIEDARMRIKLLCEEIAEVGIALDKSDAVKHLLPKVEQTLQLTADNYSSMYQDIDQQRCSEIEWLNGYLCRQAEKLEIDCPENLRLVSEIKSREAGFSG